MDGDEEALRVEAVHLDQPVLVGDGAVDDEEDEVVVVVDLRALVEMLRVFDRQGVEPEDVPQDLEVVRPGPVEIEPEEAAAREQLRDRLTVEVDSPIAAFVTHVADRRDQARGRRGKPGRLFTVERRRSTRLQDSAPRRELDPPTRHSGRPVAPACILEGGSSRAGTAASDRRSDTLGCRLFRPPPMQSSAHVDN